MTNTNQAMALPVVTRDGQGIGIIYRNPDVEPGYPGAWISVTLVSLWLRQGHEQAHRDQWDALRWVYWHAVHVLYSDADYYAQDDWIAEERAAWIDRTPRPAWRLLEERTICATCPKCGLVDGVNYRRYLSIPKYSKVECEGVRLTCPKCSTVYADSYETAGYDFLTDSISEDSGFPLDLATVMR